MPFRVALADALAGAVRCPQPVERGEPERSGTGDPRFFDREESGRGRVVAKAGSHARRRARAGWAVAGAVLACLLAGAADWAWADTDPALSTTEDLQAVVGRLRDVIVSLAAAFGTLLLTIAGLRWMLAGGDADEIDAAKRALRGAGLGYAIALLAGVLMTILDYVVKGSTA